MEKSIFIGDNFIWGIEYEKSGSKIIKKYIQLPMQQGSIVNGNIIEMSGVTGVLNVLRKEHGFEQGVLYLENDQIKRISTLVPHLSKLEYQKIAERELGKTEEQDNSVHYKIIKKQHSGQGDSIYAVSIPNALVDSYKEVFSIGGINLSAINVLEENKTEETIESLMEKLDLNSYIDKELDNVDENAILAGIFAEKPLNLMNLTKTAKEMAEKIVSPTQKITFAIIGISVIASVIIGSMMLYYSSEVKTLKNYTKDPVNLARVGEAKQIEKGLKELEAVINKVQTTQDDIGKYNITEIPLMQDIQMAAGSGARVLNLSFDQEKNILTATLETKDSALASSYVRELKAEGFNVADVKYMGYEETNKHIYKFTVEIIPENNKQNFGKVTAFDTQTLEEITKEQTDQSATDENIETDEKTTTDKEKQATTDEKKPETTTTTTTIKTPDTVNTSAKPATEKTIEKKPNVENAVGGEGDE